MYGKITPKLSKPKLRIVPVTFARACMFVTHFHRHHKAPTGNKFSIGVMDEKKRIRGVAIVGRPIARAYCDGYTLEVNRTCTDGCANANSCLYGASARIAREMGYDRIITYTQDGESGISLNASGWICIATRAARKSWRESSVKLAHTRSLKGSGGVIRYLWEKLLNKEAESLSVR